VVRLEGGILLEGRLGREEKKLGAMFGVCILLLCQGDRSGVSGSNDRLVRCK